MDSQYLPETNFYQHYADYQERSSLTTLNTLYYLSDMQNMDNILEIGAGTGTTFPLALQHKKQNAKYTVIDISKEFLQCCQQKLEFLQNYKTPQQLHQVPKFKIKKSNPEDKSKFSYTNEEFNFDLQEMSLEKMDFPSNQFDGYFESFVMHHCDWDKGLEEAHRVLKPGGKICLAEFGENVFKDILDFGPEIDALLKKLYGENFKIGDKLPKEEFSSDSNKEKQGEHDHHDHHHGHDHGHHDHHGHDHGDHDHHEHHDHEHNGVSVWDKEKIKAKLQQLGFKEIMILDQYVPVNFTKESCVSTYLMRNTDDLKSELPQKEQDELLDKIYDIAKVRNDNRDTPRGFNSILIVATKI